MKIGIVTQVINLNYGGILQNYALQTILKKLGHDPITFDFRQRFSLWKCCLITCKTIYLLFIPNRRRKFSIYPKQREQDDKISSFVDNNLLLTAPIVKYSKGLIDRHQIEVIIVGSDQVWRPCYNRFILDMFLNFSKRSDIKRIAYAASFGVDNWEYSSKLTKKCKLLVKHFLAISVREKSGVDLCRIYLDTSAKCVLDPTLLLRKDDYESLCKDIPLNAKGKLMVYLLDFSEQKIKFINDIAIAKKLEVELFSASDNISLSVEQWISKFRDADFIISDSFHGTVFSIIFQKEFISIANSTRGLSRFTSLLSQMSLEDHLISDLSNSTQYQPIDWISVNSKIDTLRNQSIEFLTDNIK